MIDGSSRLIYNDAPRKLASTVIWRAVEDYVNSQKRHGRSPGAQAPDKEEAERFLFGGGTWRDSRERWCEMADIIPETLQRAVRNLTTREIKDFRDKLFHYTTKERRKKKND